MFQRSAGLCKHCTHANAFPVQHNGQGPFFRRCESFVHAINKIIPVFISLTYIITFSPFSGRITTFNFNAVQPSSHLGRIFFQFYWGSEYFVCFLFFSHSLYNERDWHKEILSSFAKFNSWMKKFTEHTICQIAKCQVVFSHNSKFFYSKIELCKSAFKEGHCILFFCHSHIHSHNDIGNVHLLFLS